MSDKLTDLRHSYTLVENVDMEALGFGIDFLHDALTIGDEDSIKEAIDLMMRDAKVLHDRLADMKKAAEEL